VVNAASVAKMILTTESTVVDTPEVVEDEGGHGHGHNH
jgi:chaperonin GroEL